MGWAAIETVSDGQSTGGHNRLIGEKSPYLLQHAKNPVDWYPWGEEAFEKASRQKKPIFLSVGYSTCHWCHVMAHESFEDGEVASLLNASYVAIKVDREERPDIDHAYMRICQELTGQGGWPLTVIMTPAKAPFFVGTYFPKKAKHGMPGLMEVLRGCREIWDKTDGNPPEAKAILDAVEGMRTGSRAVPQSEPLGRETLDIAFGELSLTFDEINGGFGGAPKFPMPHVIIFLIRYWRLTGRAKALEMAERTLLAMREGGIFDQVGHGFSRYSTDTHWGVPHFEKMLYDNALLAYAYLEAYQATRKPEFARTAKEIFSYLEREMTSQEGGFYSAEDADSEGEEGRFYRWTEGEVVDVLGSADGASMSRILGIEGVGGRRSGVPIRLRGELVREAARRGLSAAEMETLYESWRRRLLEARTARTRPGKDRKVLTSWNGLAIAALAKGAVVLGDAGLATMGEAAARFLLRAMRRQDGRLLARYIDGEARYPAYLDDYAFLSWGLFELYGATFDPRYMDEAFSLTKEMLAIFGNRGGGGLFFAGGDASELPFRPIELHDGALPSGNSVAAMNLLRLSRATGDIGLQEEGERLLKALGGRASHNPSSHAFLMAALLYELGPSQELVVAGDRGERDTAEMLARVRSLYLPNSVVLANKGAANGGSLSSALVGKGKVNGRATLYLCVDRSCLPPMSDPNQAEAALKRF